MRKTEAGLLGSVPASASSTSQAPSPSESTARDSRHAENSDVLPLGSVAVAVAKKLQATDAERVTEKLLLQVSSVVRLVTPMNVSPSPNPLGSQVLEAKNSNI